MNISKWKLAWTAIVGLINPFKSVGESVADYAIGVLKNAITSLSDTTKEKIVAVLNTARNVLSVLNAVGWLIPTKWQIAYAATIAAVETVIEGLSDLELTNDELTKIVDGYNAAYRAWMSPDDETCVSLAYRGGIWQTVLCIAFVTASSTLNTGCASFFKNAGSRIVVGSIKAPVEVTEPTSSVSVKALYTMEGADVYTAKDSLVRTRYRNAYTNNYFYIVRTQGVQDLDVEVEPLEGTCPTNAASVVSHQ